MSYTAQFAHWHQFFESISVSSLDFYKSLEEELAAHKVPETATSRVDFLEGGPTSAKRIYLQVRRDWLTYHICVAPFGTGFFVSSRLLVSPWNTWPIMVAIAAAMALGMLIFFAVTAEVLNSGAMAFLATFAMAFPTAFLFLLIVIVWIILCLRLTYYRQDSMLAWRATIEMPVTDGSIDVVLERENRRIALEISVTSTADLELGNLRKCLAAGFTEVVMLCDGARTLTGLKKLVEKELTQEMRRFVQILSPDELFADDRLLAEAVMSEEQSVRGYKVKVHREHPAGGDAEGRRRAIGEVLAKAMRR